jgi:hypothetical protein
MIENSSGLVKNNGCSIFTAGCAIEALRSKLRGLRSLSISQTLQAYLFSQEIFQRRIDSWEIELEAQLFKSPRDYLLAF